MLKLLGSACILAGSVLAQAVRLSDRRRQWDTLSDMLSALRQMGEEIRLARTPMPLLLEYLAKDRCPDAAAFFNQTAEALRRGESLTAAWQRGISCLPLPPEDIRVLEPLGAALGGDEEQACKALAQSVYELAKHAEERAAERKAEDRQAAALCVVGAILALVLKKTSPEQALLLVLCAAVAGLALLADGLGELVDFLRELGERSGISETLFVPLYKTVGIGLVVKVGGDLCRDAIPPVKPSVPEKSSPRSSSPARSGVARVRSFGRSEARTPTVSASTATRKQSSRFIPSAPSAAPAPSAATAWRQGGRIPLPLSPPQTQERRLPRPGTGRRLPLPPD